MANISWEWICFQVHENALSSSIVGTDTDVAAEKLVFSSGMDTSSKLRNELASHQATKVSYEKAVLPRARQHSLHGTFSTIEHIKRIWIRPYRLYSTSSEIPTPQIEKVSQF